MAEPFLAEATRVGRDVAGGALRSRGEATWLADEVALVDGRRQLIVRTLGPDLATGTAGVGWFLARCSVAAGDRALADVATAALRHGLQGADTLVPAGRLDWYHGASGVAWAAIDAGRALGSAELVERGERAAREVVERARDARDESGEPALVGGAAGVVAGLLALASVGDDGGAGEVAATRASRLASRISEATVTPGAGLARGLSGIGLVLAEAAAATGEIGCRESARKAFAAERAQFEPGGGWLAPPAHAWAAALEVPDASWCRGAAGIGLARLGARPALPELVLLAEAGAAIEFVRGYLAASDWSDTSLCHGAAGAVELLLSAGVLLEERTHLHAARRAGLALLEGAWSRGRYASGFGGETRNPSLLFGLTGTGTLLLRLSEPAALPSPMLPPVPRV